MIKVRYCVYARTHVQGHSSKQGDRRKQGHRSKHVTRVIGQNRVKGQSMPPSHTITRDQGHMSKEGQGSKHATASRGWSVLSRTGVIKCKYGWNRYFNIYSWHFPTISLALYKCTYLLTHLLSYLLTVYGITGCDTVSAFGHVQKTVFRLNEYCCKDRHSYRFCRLGWSLSRPTEPQLIAATTFVGAMYGLKKLPPTDKMLVSGVVSSKRCCDNVTGS